MESNPKSRTKNTRSPLKKDSSSLTKEDNYDCDEGFEEAESPHLKIRETDKISHTNPLLKDKGSTHNGKLLTEDDFYSKVNFKSVVAFPFTSIANTMRPKKQISNLAL